MPMISAPTWNWRLGPAPFYPFDHPHDLDVADLKGLLGGKGAGLGLMTGLGISVPPAAGRA